MSNIVRIEGQQNSARYSLRILGGEPIDGLTSEDLRGIAEACLYAIGDERLMMLDANVEASGHRCSGSQR